MIGYITLGSNDLESAKKFYDEWFNVLKIYRLPGSDQFPTWGKDWSTPPALSVVAPFDGKDASSGNGVMVAIRCGSQEEVRAAYKKAIQLGASSEGTPGPRGGSGFYAGYFRDLDGNKLNVFCY